MTPHEFARDVLVQALHQPERLSANEEAILLLAKQIQQIRSDGLVVTEALLVTAGELSAGRRETVGE